MKKDNSSEYDTSKNPHAKGLRMDDEKLKWKLIRMMRSPVTNKLSELHGREFAENNAEFMSEFIIKAFLVLNDPQNFSKLLSQDQVDRIKKDFPDQLDLLKKAQEFIDAGKTADEVEGLLKLKAYQELILDWVTEGRRHVDA